MNWQFKKKKKYKGSMNKEKQVNPDNDQIDANIHNLLPRTGVKINFLSIINYFPELPNILLTRTETIPVFGNA